MKLTIGQIVEVNGSPAKVINATKTMVLVEVETANGTIRKGVRRSQVGA